MKKRFIGTVLALTVLLGGCSVVNTQKEISDAVGLDLRSAEVVSSEDTHGGFQGDGMEVTVLELSEAPDLTGLQGWHELPLSQSVERLLYGVRTAEDTDGPYLYGEDGAPLVPPVTNGSWFFLDRHSECTDPYDDSSVFDRYSFNLTVAVYDADTARLYYLEFDT